MDIETKKLALIELLLNIDEEEILDRIQELFENIPVDGNRGLNPVHYELLKERRVKHLNEESASYSWEEIKNDIAGKKNV